MPPDPNDPYNYDYSQPDYERVQPEVSIPTSVCPHPERWHCYDDMATELEVINFLYSLTLMLKPSFVIETGCYHGYSTYAIAAALEDNRRGMIYTCDTGEAEVKATIKRLGPVSGRSYVFQCTGLKLISNPPSPVDLAFLDSGPDECRTLELRALYPYLSPGGVVAIHDTGIQGFLREKYLGPAIRDLNMQAIYFDTPRGLALLRRRPEIYP